MYIQNTARRLKITILR